MLTHKGSYRKLIDKLERQPREVPRKGAKWAGEAVDGLNKRVREHLAEQGRGGEPPPLSAMTRRIYDIDGEPDGSGIVNHLTLEYRKRGSKVIAILGIPQGKPTIVAKVQDRGATIEVTDKMRGFLAAAYGIYLKATTTHIQIPGRHFWEYSVRATNREATRKLKRLFKKL